MLKVEMKEINSIIGTVKAFTARLHESSACQTAS